MPRPFSGLPDFSEEFKEPIDYFRVMKILSLVTLTLASAIASIAVADDLVEVKNVSAPPSDILSGRLRLAEPSALPTTAWTALVPLDEALARFRTGPGKTAVALITTQPDAWTFSLSPIDERAASPETDFIEQHATLEQLTTGALARVIRVDPDRVDDVISIEAIAPDDASDAWLLVADGREDIRLSTHVGSFERLRGGPLVVHAVIANAAIIESKCVVRGPSGATSTYSFVSPDGRTASATFTPDLVGDWTIRSLFLVRDEDGTVRQRSTQQVIRVNDRTVRFIEDPPTLSQAGPDAPLRIDLPVEITASGELEGDRRVALATEVWGLDPEGDSVPVCWISRIHQLPSAGGVTTLELSLDSRWLSLASVDVSSLSFRELRVHDTDGFNLIDHRAVVRPTLQGAFVVSDDVSRVTPDMMASHSNRTVGGISTNGLSSPGGHVLLLSHGYCTDQFPFRLSDFSGDYELFEDYQQNRTHDEFALRFESLGRNFKSMGIVGHSQGGHAAAHLYTFYWSALDWATDGTKIQGVGVPWLGTSLAGNAAVLGEIFGIGCGISNDLTYDGCAAWLSFIPSWVRAETDYWTTSFEDGFFYDYCQIISDLLLTDPDDGTVERYAGQLEGGNNRGHKEGWCHTRLMRDPPQCKDASRNVILDAEAAR